jgi:hypothetical protein
MNDQNLEKAIQESLKIFTSSINEKLEEFRGKLLQMERELEVLGNRINKLEISKK